MASADFDGRQIYPFTAIVDQSGMKNALVLNAVNPEIGGVLIRGHSGTAKSTAVRGLAQVLPEIEVVADCPFQCHPRDRRRMCSPCQERLAGGEILPLHRRPRRIVNLPLNATEDRVAGTLDITRALAEGVKALEPGLMAEANRGIIYIDEINLLDDHIVDILLDAAAMGSNAVEREGLSVHHPSRFMLIGTMNPEEGELRPQIADRIGLQIQIAPLTGTEERAEILRRREAFLARDNAGFTAEYAPGQAQLRASIARARELLGQVWVADEFYEAIGRLSVKFKVLSHRADLTILQCAKAMAALEGREQIEASDIFEAAKLALGHRLPHDPFVHGTAVDNVELRRELEKILGAEIELKKKPLRSWANR